jgi:hypothetical protein
MATEFKYDCPHCSTRAAGFKMLGQWSFGNQPSKANLVAACGVCTYGILIESLDTSGTNHFDVVQYTVQYPSDRYRILQTWPDRTLFAPTGVPENISSFYQQAVENLRAGRWDAAGAMFRKTLDVATKLVATGDNSANLYSRIERLVSSGLLTPAMGDGSHEIRLDGNNAVHDEEPETQSDAEASHKFTEAFLTYAFSLPQLVRESRARRELVSG